VLETDVGAMVASHFVGLASLGGINITVGRRRRLNDTASGRQVLATIRNRLLLSIPLLLVVTLVSFVLNSLSPSDSRANDTGG